MKDIYVWGQFKVITVRRNEYLVVKWENCGGQISSGVKARVI